MNGESTNNLLHTKVLWVMLNVAEQLISNPQRPYVRELQHVLPPRIKEPNNWQRLCNGFLTRMRHNHQFTTTSTDVHADVQMGQPQLALFRVLETQLGSLLCSVSHLSCLLCCCLWGPRVGSEVLGWQGGTPPGPGLSAAGL